MTEDIAELAERKLWATFSLERIDRALRQLKRMQKAYKAHADAEERAIADHPDESPILMPMSVARLSVNYDDELYFFIIAARQALNVVPVMRLLDPDFPAIRQAALITHWRDIEEHWEDPPQGKSLRALKKWRDISDSSEPALTSSSRGGRVTHVSDVSIKRLKKDLKRARRMTAKIEGDLWMHLYITPEEAAEILGVEPGVVPKLPLKRFPDFPERGGGLRFFREQVQWFADNDGDLIPDSWRPYFDEF